MTINTKVGGILLLIFCIAIQSTQAQDPHFTQFYASPIYNNAALTGTGEQEGRLLFNYRAQWTNLPGEFFTYHISYDQRLPNFKSNFGIQADFDKAGSAGLRSTSIALSYAYTLSLQEKWRLRAGMQIGYSQKTLNYLQFVFGDQLTNIGTNGLPTQDFGFENINANFLDLNAGFALHDERFWIAIAGKHLNEPTFALGAQGNGQLARRWVVQGGYKFQFKTGTMLRKNDYNSSVHPAFYWAMQNGAMQLDIGANIVVKPLLMGLWLRGVPIQSNQYGVVALVGGFKYEYFNFLYCYEFPMSRFARITGAAHEISLRLDMDYQYAPKRKFRNRTNLLFPSLLD
ncbi:MAG: type IX secretion system membrane protein PorP/SprF [Cytophagales bacterium]|nr:MAG: type IX secretion system membrane protein PorP/SprF [Cytophagales bacterium]